MLAVHASDASAARGVVHVSREDKSVVQTLVRADLEAEIWLFYFGKG